MTKCRLLRRIAVIVAITLIALPVAHVDAAAVVRVEDFSVPPEQIDAAIERLSAMEFEAVARAAALVLTKSGPGRHFSGRAPDEEELRRLESPAYTVARHVWANHTKGLDEIAMVSVLDGLSRDPDPSVRLFAVRELSRPVYPGRLISATRRWALWGVAHAGDNDPELRRTAAAALARAVPPPATQPNTTTRPFIPGDSLDLEAIRLIPGIVRSQPTLRDRHQAFNDLTNVGKRLHGLPLEDLAALARTGFELIEQTPEDQLEQAYFTARQLGFILRQHNGFAPPQADHKDATGNLAPTFFTQTVLNAREWWDIKGRTAFDTLVPESDAQPSSLSPVHHTPGMNAGGTPDPPEVINAKIGDFDAMMKASSSAEAVLAAVRRTLRYTGAGATPPTVGEPERGDSRS